MGRSNIWSTLSDIQRTAGRYTLFQVQFIVSVRRCCCGVCCLTVKSLSRVFEPHQLIVTFDFYFLNSVLVPKHKYRSGSGSVSAATADHDHTRDSDQNSHFRQGPLTLRAPGPVHVGPLQWSIHRPQVKNETMKENPPAGLRSAVCSHSFCPFQFQASESSLLSRLISICNDGRLSSRLFFSLWVWRSCFFLIMAPHIFCRVESSSSSTSSSSSPSACLLLLLLLAISFRLDEGEAEEKRPADRLLDLRSWCPALPSSLEPSLLHRPPAGGRVSNSYITIIYILMWQSFRFESSFILNLKKLHLPLVVWQKDPPTCLWFLPAVRFTQNSPCGEFNLNFRDLRGVIIVWHEGEQRRKTGRRLLNFLFLLVFLSLDELEKRPLLSWLATPSLRCTSLIGSLAGGVSLGETGEGERLLSGE